MPYNKEQLRVYWQTHKAILNQKRKEKRRLAKLGLVEQVSHEIKKVNPNPVSHQLKTASLAANLNPVSHGKPTHEMANPILAQLIKEWQTRTNYSCPPTCLYSYCNNCWYFVGDQLVNYKGLSD